MKYCSRCAAELVERIPDGDDRPRMCCTSCGAIHYHNPRTVVGCLIEEGDSILLCRRAIEPAQGRWTVPAGFLENGEGARAGALRETREEACADVEIVAPHSQLDLPHIGQTYSLFRARLRRPEFAAGAETLELGLVPFDRIPWDELAFPVVHFALRFLLEDRAEGRARLHLATLAYKGGGSRFDARHYDLEDRLSIPLGG